MFPPLGRTNERGPNASNEMPVMSPLSLIARTHASHIVGDVILHCSKILDEGFGGPEEGSNEPSPVLTCQQRDPIF